jgi:hypothetical protein
MDADRCQIRVGQMGSMKSPNRDIQRDAKDIVHEVWKKGNVSQRISRTSFAPNAKVRRLIAGRHLPAI